MSGSNGLLLVLRSARFVISYYQFLLDVSTVLSPLYLRRPQLITPDPLELSVLYTAIIYALALALAHITTPSVTAPKAIPIQLVDVTSLCVYYFHKLTAVKRIFSTNSMGHNFTIR